MQSLLFHAISLEYKICSHYGFKAFLDMDRETFPVGKLAQLAECSVETVRYYEKVGLMPEPPRTEGGR